MYASTLTAAGSVALRGGAAQLVITKTSSPFMAGTISHWWLPKCLHVALLPTAASGAVIHAVVA